MSRRRSNRVRHNTKPVTVPDAVVIIHDCEEDEFRNHRSCWKHIAYLNTRGSAKRKSTEKELELFQLTAPCYYDECTRRHRSLRRIKCKYLASKLSKKLKSNTFVNYLEDIWKGFSDEKKNSFVFIDCLWFSMYKGSNQRVRKSVFESIKEKQIFSKKYVFLPIVYWGHWTLLIFCNFGDDLDPDNENTCMLYLDSLKATNSSQQLEPDIRKFVLEIYKIEGRAQDQSLIDNIEFHVPDVPQQTNDVECGSFVLYYIQRFMEDAPENFSMEDYPYFMKKDWFSHKDLEGFCNKLDSLGNIH